jgi:hypothetical protein
MKRVGLAMGMAAIAASAMLASCADPWFAITDVSASSASSTILWVSVDGCAPDDQPPMVVETETKVRLSVLQRHGGVEPACLSGFQIQLDAPIGTRKVIDARRDREVGVTLTLPFAMPAPTWLPEGWKLQEESAGLYVGV